MMAAHEEARQDRAAECIQRYWRGWLGRELHELVLKVCGLHHALCLCPSIRSGEPVVGAKLTPSFYGSGRFAASAKPRVQCRWYRSRERPPVLSSSAPSQSHWALSKNPRLGEGICDLVSSEKSYRLSVDDVGYFVCCAMKVLPAGTRGDGRGEAESVCLTSLVSVALPSHLHGSVVSCLAAGRAQANVMQVLMPRPKLLMFPPLLITIYHRVLTPSD